MFLAALPEDAPTLDHLDAGQSADFDYLRGYPAARRRAHARTMQTLRQLLGQFIPAHAAVAVHRDLLGRPTPADGHLKIALSGHQNKLAVAFSPDMAVEVSLQRVPEILSDAMRQMLTPGEQTMLARLPMPARCEKFARLWTRKDAALRLTGRGVRGALRDAQGLRAAAQGEILVLEADGQSCRNVEVYDLPRWDGFVAAVACPGQPGRIRPWFIGDLPVG